MRLKTLIFICLLLPVSNSSLVQANGIDGRQGSSPSPPSCISIGSSPLRLSLFFCKSPERDVAGYNVYRSTDPRLPKDQWVRLNRSLLKRTTYIDKAIESGKEYFYYLTSQDAEGNSSGPSIVISEKAP